MAKNTTDTLLEELANSGLSEEQLAEALLSAIGKLNVKSVARAAKVMPDAHVRVTGQRARGVHWEVDGKSFTSTLAGQKFKQIESAQKSLLNAIQTAGQIPGFISLVRDTLAGLTDPEAPRKVIDIELSDAGVTPVWQTFETLPELWDSVPAHLKVRANKSDTPTA